MFTHPFKSQLKYHLLGTTFSYSLNTLALTLFTVLILYYNDLFMCLFSLPGYGLPKGRKNALFFPFLFLCLCTYPNMHLQVALSRHLNVLPVDVLSL